ncbi:DUF6412 domain-containing protein [Microbacterium sp.]|uniref:DUF6412 domain-containing protein n=1 Tax=Microbacterium sp. TaxID=51671 RepID=UPI003F6FF0AC
MFDSLNAALHLLLATVHLAATPDVAAFGALGIAIALVAATVVVATILAVAVPHTESASPAHPARAIDVSSPLAQSDPDASGHPRPRAPGSAVSAA